MTANLRFSAFAFFLMCVPFYAVDIGFPEPPIDFRLNLLAARLSDFETTKPGNAMTAQGLQHGLKYYVIKWTRPSDKSDPTKEENSWERIVEIAVASLKDKLPKELRPDPSKLLSVGKYQLNRSTLPPFWVWIAEFKIKNGNLSAGAGFQPTLWVPISLDGNPLAEVESK
jgi:hypothetical protein